MQRAWKTVLSFLKLSRRSSPSSGGALAKATSERTSNALGPAKKQGVNLAYKYKVNDVVIFVNIFGVVWRWTISEQTTYELHTGQVVPAYHHVGTQTPWFPTQETELFKATKADLIASDVELQQRYGFTPTEWYGCW